MRIVRSSARILDDAQLKADARPVAAADDPAVITSAADCRLTVFESIDAAKKLWIKGENFSLATLLNDAALAQDDAFQGGGALAIFRLAPADYHRYHSPVAGSIVSTKPIAGQYYTVKCAQAVSTPGAY
jgi:phosphatidylserine decarboxylase